MGSLGYQMYGNRNPDSLPEFTQAEATQIIELLSEFESQFNDDIETLDDECYLFPDNLLRRIILYFEKESNFLQYNMLYVAESNVVQDEHTNRIELTICASNGRTFAIIGIDPMSMISGRLDTIKDNLTLSKETLIRREINKANSSPPTRIEGTLSKLNEKIEKAQKSRLERWLKTLQDLNA